jgi:mannose-6-phosphate isomerase-like protein (cupin superfamily)
MPTKVSLREAFGRIHEHWKPRIAGEVNDVEVRLAKVKGEFTWHHHDDSDELFMVHRGSLLLRLRDGDVRLGPGEFIIVPRGVEHLPVADEECELVLIEPRGTRNTGNLRNERTLDTLERIS